MEAKSSSQLQSLEEPNRRSVEQLFRDLLRDSFNTKEEDSARNLRHQRDQLEKELLQDPRYLDLSRKADEASRQASHLNKQLRSSVEKVRRLYLSRGLTPFVRKKIEDLVMEINGDSD